MLLLGANPGAAQTVAIDTTPSGRRQIIDGFGTHQGDAARNATWWQQLYYDDLGASIYRVDLTPQFVSPYSDFSYVSPWFMGSGVDSPLNIEDPDNPNGPEGNRVRTYTGPEDYSRLFGGESAPIAVMGPDIDANVKYFTYPTNGAIKAGLDRMEQLGDFKLIGSLWSPAPWLKVSSGNTYGQNWWPGPVQGVAWPFIWGGNFAGGKLDVSGTPLEVFNDTALGGSGPTSALTQFARSTAAYVRGFQNTYKAQFYAISIQNELNFEEFYNSTTYPLSSQYIAALKVVREEFDKYPDLENIRLMGPEDLLGGNAYGMWQYGGNDNPTHKNLQYLQNISADPEAAEAVDFFAIHGYANDGVSSAGSDPTLWDWWANGWQNSPAAGIPAEVKGFSSYGKKSWMTETSGEQDAWLAPASGFPNDGGWSIALKLHQALTTGQQSAWLYWTFAERADDGSVTPSALTNQTKGATAPKYVAAKHFFRYIRPNAVRVAAAVTGSDYLKASAYVHDEDAALTVVLINTSPDAQAVAVEAPGASSFDAYTSSEGSYWQNSKVQVQNGTAGVVAPGYSVVTLYATSFTPTAVEDSDTELPGSSRLFQNYPNPFNPTTTIRYELAETSHVLLTVYDVTGRSLVTIVDEIKSPGAYETPFQASDLPGGVYIYTLKAGSFTDSKTLVLLK